jgi:hypothetical protein
MRRLFTIGMTLAGIGGASADWHNTRWGMSAEQLRAADPSLQAPSDAEQSNRGGAMGAPLLKGTHKMGGKDFGSWYYFRNGALARVRLEAEDRHSATAVLADLRAALGQPTKEKSTQFIETCELYDLSWTDTTNRNTIRFDGRACHEDRVKWTNYASVYYEPLPTP